MTLTDAQMEHLGHTLWAALTVGTCPRQAARFWCSLEGIPYTPHIEALADAVGCRVPGTRCEDIPHIGGTP